jgi:hypothetical protein
MSEKEDSPAPEALQFKGLPEAGMWSSLKLDWRYCWKSLKAVSVEHDWSSVMKALLAVDKGLKEIVGGGVVFIVCNLAYFYFVFPVAGIAWTIVLYLLLICAFLWTCVHAVRVSHDMETQEHNGELGTLRAELRALQTQLTNAEIQTQEARSNCRELETERGSLRANLNASEQRYAEITKHKLVYEVRQEGSTIFVKDQGDDPPMILAKIALRFENRDTFPWSVKGLDIALCEQGGKDIFAFTSKAYSLNEVAIKREVFESMLIQAGATTKFHLLDAVLDIKDERIKKPSDLDVVHFLKITLRCNAIQSPVEGKFHVIWESALRDEGAMPHLIRGVPTIDRFDEISGL